MKNILLNKIIFCAIAFIAFSNTAMGENEIEIIYPKDSQFVSAVDSTFILGNIKHFNYKYDVLKINNHIVKVHSDGGFIAFLPIEPGWFTFDIKAYLKLEPKTKVNTIVNKKYFEKQIVVKVPEPLIPIPFDSLTIDSSYKYKSGHNVYRAGDRIQVSFKGTSQSQAWFSIAGVADTIRMVETNPKAQPYWGESVFGAGAVPDSMLVEGIYTGFIDITESMGCDSVNIIYHLKPYSPSDYAEKFKIPLKAGEDFNLLKFLIFNDSDKVEYITPQTISINNPDYPFTVKFTDSVQIIRHGPRMGYFSIFQPEGVEALVVGKENNWYIAQLSQTQKAWIHESSVERLPKGILPPHSYISVVRLKSSKENLTLEFPLSGKHPFRIIEEDKQHIKIQLFGVTSNTDWIRYDFSDDLVELAVWSQPEPDLYELSLNLSSDIWGYDTYYKGNSFYFQINKAPEKVNKLRGKTIVIDPGHSSDKGSVGPTGLTEAEANLGIALALRDRLMSKGVNVIMTRDDMSHVALYDRPSIAKANNADLFVSIHNNALPDGVNPFVHNGSSTYYYHPHSIELAKAIQKELIKETKLSDYGLYHGNLAVNRPTQYPAVLVECAFMILPEQEALLKTEKFQKKVAKAITKGIEKFLKGYDND